jgi:REP element-mobilizing transposase RayT
MEKFKNKYRIPSARLQNWNYCWEAAYFITICTKDRINFFGEIQNNNLILSPLGEIAENIWNEIPNHFSNVESGAFVVMPNHVHGILIITGFDENICKNIQCVDRTHIVETGHALSLQQFAQINNIEKNIEITRTIGQQRFQHIGCNSISSIVGSYKSAVTKQIRRSGYEFHWQTRFFDHIIRNDSSFQNITEYILNNPANWQKDAFFL